MPFLETETRSGEPRRVGEYEITPMNQVLTVKFPGYHAGLVWNRPKSVMIRNDEGQEQILPVNDVTRIAIWAMLLGGLLGALVMGLMFRHR